MDFSRIKDFFTRPIFGDNKPVFSNDFDMLSFMLANQNNRIDSDRAMRCSTVNACVNLISSIIAQLPLVLYKRTEKGREVASEHKLYDILHDTPNDYQTPIDFFQFMIASMLLTGKGCAYIARAGGRVVSLNPISPDKIEEVWEDNGDHYFRTTVKGKDLRLLPKDIFCVKGLTLDGKNAINPIEYAATTIGVSLKASEHNSNFLSNGGRPAGMLQTSSVLKKEVVEAIRAEWKKNFTGANTGNVAVLHGGYTYSPISMSNADAQLLQIMGYGRNEIAALFGVPPYLVGGVETSSSWGTGISEQRQNLVTFTLSPWMTRIQQAITRDLLNDKEKKEYYAEFKTDAFLRVNTESRYGAYQIALGGANNPGFLTINEIRSRENLPLVENGDQLFIPNYNSGGSEDGQ